MSKKDKSTSAHKGEEHLVSKNKYFDVDSPVFWPAAALIVAFIVITLSVGEPMNDIFASIQTSISDNGGWFFILSVNLFLFFMLFIAFSKFGSIRLGGANAKP
ncbi:MAG: BCCT family transporter, partial [Bacteroidota bacterium]